MVKVTKKDRDALLKLADERGRVLKTTAARRTADLMAQFEVELQTRYKEQENEVFDRVTSVMGAALEAARKEIDKECDRLMVRKRFRPQIGATWNPGGATGYERELLLELAKKQAKAQEMRAIEQIEHDTVEIKTGIIASSLDTEAAGQLLNSMPMLEDLMPPMTFKDIDSIFRRDPERMLREYNESQKEKLGYRYRRLRSDQIYSLAPPPDKNGADGGTTVSINNDDDYE